MNNVYERIFKVSINYILNFIKLLENFEERRLVKGFSIIYDTTNKVFSARVDFEDGKDYKLFHNIAVCFMSGIKVEEY